jgi:hypothetical protein
MTKFLAGVLTVIAAGVLLIAYGLLGPQTEAYSAREPLAGPMLANERMMLRDAAPAPAVHPYAVVPVNPYAANAYAYDARYMPSASYGGYAPVAAAAPVQAVPIRTAVTDAQPQARPAARAVERAAPKRNWKKTAAVIGGSSAAGAGVGAIFGGKKGALIGAAIGGGASTIYEVTKKD